MCKRLPYNIVNYTGEQQALLVLVGTFLNCFLSDSQPPQTLSPALTISDVSDD